MSNWYGRAVQQIEGDYDAGLIDSKEYQAQMRDLKDEMRQSAQDAADQAYDDAMGGW